jgi:hypothetical protein
MTSYSIKFKPLDGEPSFPDIPCQNKLYDVSRGAVNACEFPLPKAESYGILQVFCKNCRHLNNIMMTGGEGDFSAYRAECGKIRQAVTQNNNRQLELAV